MDSKNPVSGNNRNMFRDIMDRIRAAYIKYDYGKVLNFTNTKKCRLIHTLNSETKQLRSVIINKVEI